MQCPGPNQRLERSGMTAGLQNDEAIRQMFMDEDANESVQAHATGRNLSDLLLG
jgi:hypothetical protein